MIKIKPYLDKVTLRNLYFTFVYPYLIYCVEVWGNACDTHLDPIIKIQKKCVRVITFSHYLEPTDSLFKDLKILVFKKLVFQRILLMMFKHHIGIVPKPISSLFKQKSEIHNYNTRHCSSLHPAIDKSEATYRTFTYHAILIWNYLSKLICTNATLACFKKRSLVYLQTHRELFDKYCVCIYLFIILTNCQKILYHGNIFSYILLLFCMYSYLHE